MTINDSIRDEKLRYTCILLTGKSHKYQYYDLL